MSGSRSAPTAPCAICGETKPHAHLLASHAINPNVTDLIRAKVPDWDDSKLTCRACLNKYRREYVESLLREERGELSKLEQSVVESISKQEMLSSDAEEDFAARATLGDRMADKIATFGGSWKFIILFIGMMVVWMMYNVITLTSDHFDPYPFVLLNLVLSCLAALQAPIIMMSQNRQDAKDRIRSENDFRVNLKAELEIRHLHEKIDHLLSRQWERMAEIQRVQLELMDEQKR